MHEATKLVRKEELLRLVLSGYMLKECAKHMGMSYQTIRKYVKESDFMTELKLLSQDIWSRVDAELQANASSITERLEKLTDIALTNLEKMMSNELFPVLKEETQTRLIFNTLDRNAESGTKRSVDSKTTIDINPDLLRLAAQTAKEMDEQSR